MPPVMPPVMPEETAALGPTDLLNHWPTSQSSRFSDNQVRIPGECLGTGCLSKDPPGTGSPDSWGPAPVDRQYEVTAPVSQGLRGPWPHLATAPAPTAVSHCSNSASLSACPVERTFALTTYSMTQQHGCL